MTVKAKYQCSFSELKDDENNDFQFPRSLGPKIVTNGNGNVVPGKDNIMLGVG